MIADAVEESLSLDYKRADSLNKTDDKKKAEIVRDVTAMANSSGGTLIYGIAEFSEKSQRHLPERLDPISRTEISKEWLDQIIQSIHPRVENVVIHPVTIDEKANTVCYVVEVPQSYTAHQARDHVYYKRHNFQNLPMQDYEVRDVMNRRTNPRIKASIFINRRPNHHSGKGLLLVKLENVGRVLARHFMVDLELPIYMDGFISFGEGAFCEHTDHGCYLKIRLAPGIAQPPMFPGSGLTIRREFDHVRLVEGADHKPLVSTTEVKITVFADEMPPIRTVLPIKHVLKEWTTVE